jgi:hypothetical protein
LRGEDSLEETESVDAPHRPRLLAVDEHAHFERIGAKSAHDEPRFRVVRSEDRMRVRVFDGCDALELVGRSRRSDDRAWHVQVILAPLRLVISESLKRRGHGVRVVALCAHEADGARAGRKRRRGCFERRRRERWAR